MKGKVLIVDDNPDLVGTLRDVLAPHYEVTTASRGSEAIAIAQREELDVAVVDVKLPDANGVDLIEPLRKGSPYAEVVLVTGYASVDAAIAALRSGAFAFVLKSFRPEELISTVDQANTKVSLKREREALERRYRSLVELTDVVVVGLDATGHVRLFNRKAAELAATSSDEAIGKDFVDTFIREEDRPRVRDALAQAEKDDRGGREVEARLAGRLVRWHLSRARESEEQPIVYGIGVDVTERRALEKRAADAEALSAMGTLALNLAHEIRNPLNAAVLQLHLLGRDIGKLAKVEEARRAQMHRRTDIVGSEIGRLSRLLTEFLELARPRGIAREPVHLGRLVDEVLDLERDTAKARGIELVRETSGDGIAAIGDREKLKQVVINLVVNAIEAMKEGGTLTARVSSPAPSDDVTLEIVDTGPGIDADVIANVFDPFFTTKEAGTGLGLSIVRKIVDQHGGDVRIESVRDQGTRVCVRIPSGR